jgi:pteridine reductase
MPKPTPVALVTGAAKRVGRQIALSLAEAGFDLAITYHTSGGDALRLARQIRAKGRKCLTIDADLSDPATATAAIAEQFSRSLHRLDVLVNNASLWEARPLGKIDVVHSRRLWAIHVESPLLLCQHFESLLRRSRGHVINMVDLVVEHPTPDRLAYTASKAGLWSLTLGLARALAPEVTVNGIAPGAVIWPKNYQTAERNEYLKRVPLARVGSPKDVADAVLFFARPQSYITGQILRLDGGRSIT